MMHKQPLTDMELGISQRVVYTGDSTHGGRIGTIVDVLRGSGKYGVRFAAKHTAYMSPRNISVVNAHDSITDGTLIDELLARVVANKEENFLPDHAVGKVFKIVEAHNDNVCLDCNDSNYHNMYYVMNDCFKIVPKHMEGWVRHDFRLVRESLRFCHFDGGQVIWKNEFGSHIKDCNVSDNITDALDTARIYIATNEIEVVR